VAIQVQC